MHTGGVTPTVARRLLYGIVAGCLALTASAALFRPPPRAATAPQHSVVTDGELPDAVPQQFTVTVDGLPGQSYRVNGMNGVVSVTVHVHGLPGQVAASP
jgi:hypothetical protein